MPSTRLTALARPSLVRRLTGPLFAAALAAGSLTLAAAPARAENAAPRIAIVDVNRAVAETEEGLRVQARLKRDFEKVQADLEARGRQLQADKESLEKEARAGKSAKEVIAKKAEKLDQQYQDYQRAMMEAERDFQRKQQEWTNPILLGVLDAVKRIAQQDGYDMVLQKQAAPFFRADLELTDRVITMYNGGAGKTPAGPQKGAPAPAPQKPAAPPAPAPKK